MPFEGDVRIVPADASVRHPMPMSHPVQTIRAVRIDQASALSVDQNVRLLGAEPTLFSQIRQLVAVEHPNFLRPIVIEIDFGGFFNQEPYSNAIGHHVGFIPVAVLRSR